MGLVWGSRSLSLGCMEYPSEVASGLLMPGPSTMLPCSQNVIRTLSSPREIVGVRYASPQGP
eukprot:8039156-Pyramimonas_sp.AAC.1